MKENTYCVIMAGGVGSRFWPFSRNNKPKQFLDFFGTRRSLIQMTVDRFRPLVPIENILIVTNVQYKDIVLEQIPDMKPSQVLCEPAPQYGAVYCVRRVAYSGLANTQSHGGGYDGEMGNRGLESPSV